MSELDIIGAVVGTWSVLVDSLALNKATEHDLGARGLLRQLRTEELVYKEFVHRLLAPIVPEADLVQLSSPKKPDRSLWRDRTLLSSLGGHLGDARSEDVLGILEKMKYILHHVMFNLKVYEPVVDAPRSKLGESNRNRFQTLLLERNLVDLGALNSRLQRLISNHTTSDISIPKRLSDSPPVLSFDIIRRTSAYASDLYDAIWNGYRCNCPFPHQVILRPHEALSSYIQDAKTLEIFFSVGADVDEIFVDRDPGEIWDQNLDCLDSSKEQRHRSRLIRFMSLPESSCDLKNFGLIDDLCTFAKKNVDNLSIPAPGSFFNAPVSKMKEKFLNLDTLSTASSLSNSRSWSTPRSLSTSRSFSNSRSLVTSDTSSAFSVTPWHFVCLEDCLPPGLPWGISTQERVDLALNLSTAIVIFYSTPWINMLWTWKDLYVSKDNLTQIFLSKKFYGSYHSSLEPSPRNRSRQEPESLFWACFGEPILTRLGFALIELALGKRLSELRPADVDPSSDEDMSDMLTAKSVMAGDSVLREVGMDYYNVVQVCLSHQVILATGMKSLDSSHPSFQADLDRFVVTPIRNFRESVREWLPSSADSGEELRKKLVDRYSVMESANRIREPDWITFEWEIPEVISSMCDQKEQPMSLGEILRTTVVLIGYDSHYEAAICQVYLEREWGNIGKEIVDMLISGIGGSPEKLRHYIKSFSIETNRLSIFCLSSLSRVERDSVIEAIDWLCRAIRVPTSLGVLSISSSSSNLQSSAVKDCRVHLDPFVELGEQCDLFDVQHSFRLQGLSPLPQSQELCWRALFKSGVVAMRSCKRKPPLSNDISFKGLEISFELMVQLSAVELPVLVDGGIVLVGYQTALIPIFGTENFIQWHLEINDRGQINPYDLNSTKREWLKLQDWESFKGMRCFVGWCSSAHINLGTSLLTDKVGWSDSKVQKKTLHWSGISLGFQAATTNPMQVGFTVQANFSFVPNKVNFTTSSSFARLLKDTSRQVAAVVDCLYDRSWMVPKLSLMLHMAHAWSARNCIEPDPIPYANPSPDGGQAETALRDSGDLVLLGHGQDTLTLRQLMLGLNVNLLQSRQRTEDAASGKIYGFEFMDIVCEPPMGGNMKRVSVKSLGKCWFSVVNQADAVVLCANLGQAIMPLDQSSQRHPSCSIVPPGRGYLAAPLSCLTELIIREGRQDSDLNAAQDEIFKISGDYFWKITGNPFEDCKHSGQDIQTCWEREDLLQRLTKRSSFKGMLKDGKQMRSCDCIHPSGAVVFGDRSVRIDIYSIRRILGSEKSTVSAATV